MKQRWILLAAALLLTGLTACQADRAASAPSHAGCTTARPGQAQTTGGTQAGEAAEVRVLIAWFSRTGHTEQLAEQIHSRVGGDMFRIETRQPYPQAYEAVLQRAEQERREDARPALSAAVEDMEAYDVVFLGYPIWLGDVPMAVRHSWTAMPSPARRSSRFAHRAAARQRRVSTASAAHCRIPVC